MPAFYTGQGKTNVLIMAFKSPWNQFGKGKENNLSNGKITRIDVDGSTPNLICTGAYGIFYGSKYLQAEFENGSPP